jgi:RNA polymerase-binding protein DksA
VAKKKSSKKSARKSAKKKTAKKAGKKTTKKAPRKKSAAKKSGKKSARKPVRKKSPSTPKKAVKKKTTRTTKKAKSPAKRKKAGKKSKKSSRLKSPLSKAQLKKYREMLLEKRRSLLGDMAGMEIGSLGRNHQESSGDLSTMPTHPADIGSDNFEHEFTLGLLQNERALLADIDDALMRIDEGTYGICLGTGKPIGKPRLTARPWCKYCIEYQRQIEQGLIRPGEEDRREELFESDEDEEEAEEAEEADLEDFEDEGDESDYDEM